MLVCIYRLIIYCRADIVFWCWYANVGNRDICAVGKLASASHLRCPSVGFNGILFLPDRHSLLHFMHLTSDFCFLSLTIMGSVCPIIQSHPGLSQGIAFLH